MHKKICENKDFCSAKMPSKDTKTLAFNQYQQSDKVQFNIYADLECLIEKIDRCKNSPENWSTTSTISPTSEHIPEGFQYLQWRYLKAQKISMKIFLNP